MELSKVTLEIFTKLEQKWLSHCETTKKTRILSIDGGGTTGIVAGAALVHLEDQIRLKTGDPHARIADFFDLIAGTGVGALLAVMISADDGSGRPLFSARDAVNLIAAKNSELFKLRLAGVFRRRKRYSGKSMDTVLKEMFNREDGAVLTLKDTCKPLLVPCFDLKSSAPFVFSRADASESPSFNFELWKVCRATSATPSLFKPFNLTSVDGKTSCSAVDGGLVMNNPTAAAVTHALHNKRDFPPIPTNRPTKPLPNPSLKFTSTTLPLPPLPPQSPSPSSVPLDTLLQHLFHLSSPPITTATHRKLKPLHPPRYTNHNTNTQFPSFHISAQLDHKQVHHKKPTSLSAPQFEEFQPEDGDLQFLSRKGKIIFNSILEQPLSSLNAFFDSAKFELLEVDVDLISLLKALDISGNWERALLLFEWVFLNSSSQNEKLDNQVIEIMVRILGRESQHSFASKLFDVIPVEEYSLDVRAYTTILHAHSRTGKYGKAITLFEKMKESGVSPTLVTYNVMLDVYGKMGRSWNKILGLLDEMRGKGLEFDEFTCSTVISACGREGLLDEAKEFLNGLKSQGYVPGTVTYNSLLQVFGKAGIYSEALSILKEMEDNNCPPDSVTYNELVSAYVKAGFYDEGAAVIDTMTRKGVMPNAVTYTTVINAYGRAGKEGKALRLFNQMKELGCVPNVCTYNAILGMLGKRSRSEDMIKIVCDMKLNGCAPNRITWNTMLAMCGDKGKEKYLNRILQEMKSCGFEPDRDTFNTLISAYGRCGSQIDAAKMSEEMIKAGYSPCVTTYNAFLNALARRGDFVAAESVILDMRNKGFKPNETSYSLMLHCYAKGGNVQGIEKIEKEIYDGHIYPSWMLLRTLVLANFKCRALTGMERAFLELQKNGYKPDLVLFNSMLSLFAKRNMYDRAQEMLHLIRETGLQPDLVTYNSLMDMYARGGECWKAEEVLKVLQKSGGKPDLVSYNTVIKGFCRQGLMQEAIRTLSEMMTRGIRPCIFTYNTFVAGYVGQGMFTEVDEVISYMIQNNCKPNELTYKTVVDGYCKARKYQEAIDFVSKTKGMDNSFDDSSVQRLTSRIREYMES